MDVVSKSYGCDRIWFDISDHNLLLGSHKTGDAAHMETVEEKTACLAKFSEDEAWYRGYILEKSLAAAKVHFVDYGNKEDVPFDKIKVSLLKVLSFLLPFLTKDFPDWI